MMEFAETKLRCAGINRSYKASWTPFLVLKAVARFLFILINNLYGIPAYLLWMLLLRPLHWHQKTAWLYWWLEGIMFRALLMQVSSWIYTNDYKIREVGDDIRPVLNEPCLVICNHQSTGDVPILMYAFQSHKNIADKVMWIMDIMFKYSNFGFVSQVHGDFFIQQGKATRHLQLDWLREHLLSVYRQHCMKWIVLFPEGGFLRKRRDTSNKFARSKGLPELQHVTLPRVGAMKVCIDTLAKQQNGYHTAHPGKSPPEKESSSALKWVIDVTIGYPQAQPLDMFSITFGHRPPCTTQLLYQVYPVSELPRGEDALLQWMYARYTEKEALLDTLYATGDFPPLPPTAHAPPGSQHQGEEKRYVGLSLPLVVAANLAGIGTVYAAWCLLAWPLSILFSILSIVLRPFGYWLW